MFDCFMMNYELDIVEARLNILNSIIEKFVIVESRFTHTGISKELYFLNAKNRFRKFESKIIHLIYDNLPPLEYDLSHKAWFNERGQRNEIIKALEIAIPTDNLLFISDADEIAKPEKLLEARELCLKKQVPISLALNDCMYYMNYASERPFLGPYIYNPFTIQAFHNNWTYSDGSHPPSDPTTLRWHVCSADHPNDFHRIYNAGWHFSMLGDKNTIRKKLESNAHVEFNTEKLRSDEYLQKCIDNGISYFEELYNFGKEPTKYSKKDISFLPAYIKENKQKYESYIL